MFSVSLLQSICTKAASHLLPNTPSSPTFYFDLCFIIPVSPSLAVACCLSACLLVVSEWPLERMTVAIMKSYYGKSYTCCFCRWMCLSSKFRSERCVLSARIVLSLWVTSGWYCDKLSVLSCLLPTPTTVTSHYTVKNSNRLIVIHTAFVCPAFFSCLLSYLDLKQWEKKLYY